VLSIEELEEALADPARRRFAEALIRLDLLELCELDEVDICKTHPAYLVDRMVGQDERTGETFHFDVLTAEERHAANFAVIDTYGENEEGWPRTLGWRGKDGRWFWQRELLDEWEQSQRHIDLKARQLGATWLACGKTLHTALYLPGSLSLMYRQKQEEAFENVGRVWTLLHSLPEHLWHRAQVTKPSKGAPASEEIRLEFTDRKTRRKQSSRILAMTSASASGHGKTAALVVLDEFSRIDRAGEIMKAVQPAAGRRGKLLVISTANGVSNQETGEGNQFHWLWTNAEEAGFRKRFLPWSLHPDRDQAWYDRDPEVRGLKSHERAEQYPADEFEAFTLTNRVFFDPEDLAFYGKNVRRPLYRMDFELVDARHAKQRKHDRGMVHVYAEPDADRKYAVGADVATGRGVDYSAAYVVDLSTMELVAEFHGRLDADLYAAQLHYLGRWYNTALLAVETAGGYGEAVIIPLRDGRAGRPAYPALYRHVLSSRPDLPISKPYGFPTNVKTRPLVINQLDKALRDRALPYVTAQLLSEMQTFVYRDHGPSPAAQEGARDDCVMAAAITLEMFRLRGSHPERKRKRARRPRVPYPWMREPEPELEIA
jgi:hypothetical protein